MKLSSLVLAAALAISSSDAFAQQANPLTANAKIQFGALTGFVIRSAEKVPEDLYAFRPTPDIRSMGQLYGHVADALFGMCATAAGSKPPRTGIEKYAQEQGLAEIDERVLDHAKDHFGM